MYILEEAYTLYSGAGCYSLNTDWTLHFVCKSCKRSLDLQNYKENVEDMLTAFYAYTSM